MYIGEMTDIYIVCLLNENLNKFKFKRRFFNVTDINFNFLIFFSLYYFDIEILIDQF